MKSDNYEQWQNDEKEDTTKEEYSTLDIVCYSIAVIIILIELIMLSP